MALAIGPHIIKLIPQIKSILEIDVINNTLDIGMILDGLNILWALGVELFYIFKFHHEYKKNQLTMKYVGKRFINIGIAFSFSIIGNLVVKAFIYGFTMVSGISLAPFVTITGIIGSGIFGYLGNNFGNYIAEKVLGKDEFKLTSAHLYYRYIPEKYRKPGNNPHLQWNDNNLPEVKSYIIECIVNDVDTQMRVMNIPKDVFELPECLGYYPNSQTKDDEETDFSSDGEVKNEKEIHRLYKNKKFIGDLIIPYKGIKNNTFKIDFIIYRINKKKISVKEWIDFRDRESKKNLIHDCFIYSVY